MILAAPALPSEQHQHTSTKHKTVPQKQHPDKISHGARTMLSSGSLQATHTAPRGLTVKISVPNTHS